MRGGENKSAEPERNVTNPGRTNLPFFFFFFLSFISYFIYLYIYFIIIIIYFLCFRNARFSSSRDSTRRGIGEKRKKRDLSVSFHTRTKRTNFSFPRPAPPPLINARLFSRSLSSSTKTYVSEEIRRGG